MKKQDITAIKNTLLQIKGEEGSTQDKAQSLVEFVNSLDENILFETFVQFSISSIQYLQEDIFQEAVKGNLQSIKNKIEDIKDFSVKYYYEDGNANYRDLTNDDLCDCIDEMIERLEQ